ncbi:MAG TPA: type II toxin-antitoxin system death-on-curing family toxin [Candidatus Dormibacteraeota bacterium]
MSGRPNTDFVYLETEDVLGLYSEIFRCSVVEARDQLRNLAGLEGALARPMNYAQYQAADFALQAAVLAVGIAETQPFVEGNKRTALAAMLTFIAINGYELITSQEQLAGWIIRVSAELDEDGLAALIRAALVPSGPS